MGQNTHFDSKCRKNTWHVIRQLKVNKVKNFLPFQKFMKRPQTKFHAETMSHSKVMRSKFIVEFLSLSIFYWSCSNRFWYVLQIWNSNGFVATFDVITLLSPQLDDWVNQAWQCKKHGLTALGLANAQFIMYILCFNFVIRYSQIWLYCRYWCTYQHIMFKVKQPILKSSKYTAWICYYFYLNT